MLRRDVALSMAGPRLLLAALASRSSRRSLRSCVICDSSASSSAAAAATSDQQRSNSVCMALTLCVLVAEDVSLRAANRASAEATALSMLESVKAAMEKFYPRHLSCPG